MKTTTRLLTTYGNLGLVQVKVEPETNLLFKPGTPELRTGGLIISESTGAGIVGQLMAINNTGVFLLLTDADVLQGAKQNRIVNKSILLAPFSKTVIDVSCVERLRWHYTSVNFSNPDSVANPDLRKEKAGTFSQRKNKTDFSNENTQSVVWSHVSRKLREAGCPSSTESYAELIDYKMKGESRDFPVCEPERGCNGLAVIHEGKVISADLFGREEVYRHYFPLLRDSAFRIAHKGNKDNPINIHEAYYKVLEALDNFEAAVREPENSYTGYGSLNMVEGNDLLGTELHYEGQLIHDALFAKQV